MTRAPIDKCVHCGEPEAAHHEFARAVPSGCQCGLKNTEPPPCDAFDDQVPYFSWCGRCMHARECHAVVEPEHECRCAEARTNLLDAAHGGYYDSRGYGHCIFCGHDRECHEVKR